MAANITITSTDPADVQRLVNATQKLVRVVEDLQLRVEALEAAARTDTRPPGERETLQQAGGKSGS